MISESLSYVFRWSASEVLVLFECHLGLPSAGLQDKVSASDKARLVRAGRSVITGFKGL